MSLYKIQGRAERKEGVYYEFNTEDTPLGEGGMGKVYRGRCVEERTGRSKEVAVKFLYDDLPPYAIEKARREASIRFRHPNLVEMLGFIQTETKSPIGETIPHYHVVSELITGVSLDNFFEGRLTDQRGNLVPFAQKLYRDYQQSPSRFAVEIVKNVLSGLMAMHDAGYIHRDIDPTNIMLTTNGQIKLIDFGIAKKFNSLTTSDKHLTQAGQFVGKPEYAAPELVLGAIDEQNQTTDIYAVGILLFRCVVGHVPFEGDRSEVLQKQIHSPLPLKLVKNAKLREIIAKATQKSRSKRYQSAAEFRVALEQWEKNPNPGFVWKRSYSYIAIGVAACVVAAVVVMLIPVKTESSPPEPLRPREMPDYATVVSHMRDTVNYPGVMTLTALQALSESGSSEASFLLSQLYFKSNSPSDYCPDSIMNLKEILKVSPDNRRAFDLLNKAVEQDPTNYHALYELGLDYWNFKRTDAVDKDERYKGEQYFQKAKEYAVKASDTRYMESINSILDSYQEWKENHAINNNATK